MPSSLAWLGQLLIRKRKVNSSNWDHLPEAIFKKLGDPGYRSSSAHSFHKGFMKFLCPTHSGFGWRCNGQWFRARKKFFRLNWLMLLNLGRVHKDIRIWVAFESDS
ncbi:PREDICTED: PRUPE_1G233500 [Prunus dulcis]|uniref:PREDICTED: PRUPE_1G233500 n=1 Tax=Prunus dulcis TaxID=3755 RepID=A0A5E4G5P7_PRUDU|nr:PREDICTED: PRUPE_1G233500 [Prunus dulcis]